MAKLSLIFQCDRWRSGRSLRGTWARLKQIFQAVVFVMVHFQLSKGIFQSISWFHFEHCSAFHIFQKHLPVFVHDGTRRKLSLPTCRSCSVHLLTDRTLRSLCLCSLEGRRAIYMRQIRVELLTDEEIKFAAGPWILYSSIAETLQGFWSQLCEKNQKKNNTHT